MERLLCLLAPARLMASGPDRGKECYPGKMRSEREVILWPSV